MRQDGGDTAPCLIVIQIQTVSKIKGAFERCHRLEQSFLDPQRTEEMTVRDDCEV